MTIEEKVNVIRNKIREDLGNFLMNRGIESFKVICDETNNSREMIDRNRLNVDIYLSGQFAEFAKEQLKMDEPDETAVYMSNDDVYKFADQMHSDAIALRDELLYKGYPAETAEKRMEFCEAVMEMAYRLKELEK